MKKNTSSQKKSGPRCKKCKSRSFRYEAACKVCMRCGWVKYRANATYDQLWHQDLLNKQILPATLMTQIFCAYKSPDTTLKYLKPVTQDDLNFFESFRKAYPDSLSKCPRAPR